MGGMKISNAFEINEDQLSWLKDMATRYELNDEHKALRVVLDHAMTEGDADVIFKEVRCHHCG